MIPHIQMYGKIDWIMTTNRYILNENIEILPPKERIMNTQIIRNTLQLNTLKTD